MQKLGKRQLTLNLQEPMTAIPDALGDWPLALKAKGYRAGVHLRRARRAAGRYLLAAAAPGRAGHRLQGSEHPQSSLEDIFVSLVSDRPEGGAVMSNGTTIETRPRAATPAAAPAPSGFNRHGVWAIYRFEMARFMRTLLQSVVTPVITTSLYFVVFGSAIGSRMSEVERRALRRLHRARSDHAVAVHREHLATPRSASTSPSSPARSTSCCRRRSRSSR